MSPDFFCFLIYTSRYIRLKFNPDGTIPLDFSFKFFKWKATEEKTGA
jgi:hypothetical protein